MNMTYNNKNSEDVDCMAKTGRFNERNINLKSHVQKILNLIKVIERFSTYPGYLYPE